MPFPRACEISPPERIAHKVVQLFAAVSVPDVMKRAPNQGSHFTLENRKILARPTRHWRERGQAVLPLRGKNPTSASEAWLASETP
ncbi:MAG: hypothetical protein H0W34_06010 [Pyrinomonadaceae bacterium]|nr:hypothetical protein [Pyrinomonadaceae bacterium]